MAVAKVQYGGTTLIDLTQDTASAADVLTGKTFHASDGTIQTGTNAGGGIADKDIIERTASVFGQTLTNTTASYVAVGAFAYCTTIKQVDLSVTTISHHAFAQCLAINSINLPNCTTISDSAFYAAMPSQPSEAVTISAPKCTTVGSYAFTGTGNYWYASNLYFPSVTTIGAYAFHHQYGSASATFTSCTKIGSNAFAAFMMETAGDEKSWEFPACSDIGEYAFCSRRFQTLSLPDCLRVQQYAFNNAVLFSISLPMCTTIGTSAFASATLPTNLELSQCTSVQESAFASVKSLATISMPALTVLSYGVFYSATDLIDVYVPSVSLVGGGTAVSSGTFRYCTALQLGNTFQGGFQGARTLGYGCFANAGSITSNGIIPSSLFPNLKTVGNCAFQSTNIVGVYFDAVATISGSAFLSCASLTIASFPALVSIPNSTAFRGCHRLISLYLMGSTVATLSNSTAFSSTPIGGYSTVAGQYGSVYVPASLLATYKAATGWKSISTRIVGI